MPVARIGHAPAAASTVNRRVAAVRDLFEYLVGDASCTPSRKPVRPGDSGNAAARENKRGFVDMPLRSCHTARASG